MQHVNYCDCDCHCYYYDNDYCLLPRDCLPLCACEPQTTRMQTQFHKTSGAEQRRQLKPPYRFCSCSDFVQSTASRVAYSTNFVNVSGDVNLIAGFRWEGGGRFKKRRDSLTPVKL